MNQRGISLLEIVLVFVIAVTTATLATVSMQAGFENRRAKQVESTLQSIGHAVRMYELENGALPTKSDLSEVFEQGFLDSQELAYGKDFNYTFVPNAANPSQWSIQAIGPHQRQVEIENQPGSFAVSDSAGFLHSSSTTTTSTAPH